MMAVPFHQALRDTSFLNAWFEMVSDFTTTGATLYDAPGRLLPSLHLWRALVGWMGGFFVLLSAAAVLAPLDLGGIEVISGKVPGRAARGAGQVIRGADPSERLVRHTLVLFPVYTGLTLVLWVLLLLSGDTGLTALSLAMSTLSTSGITPEIPILAGRSGIPGEIFIFVFMTFALTRRSLPGAVLTNRSRSILSDHEVRLAAFLLVLVPAILFLRHWWALRGFDEMISAGAIVGAIWGALFTTASFLTTTGFESSDWQITRAWSGLGNPGLILMGLAMVGGGIATTAGGLKLLRVYALTRHGERELDRLVHPNSVGGEGEAARRLRQGGAYVSWIFFMLFAITFAIVVALLALLGIEFEQGLVLTVAAVTTTGPLTSLALQTPIRLLELGPEVKFVLAGAMIVGRMEVLAILTLFSPGLWRR